jgi:hypothetical protein
MMMSFLLSFVALFVVMCGAWFWQEARRIHSIIRRRELSFLQRANKIAERDPLASSPKRGDDGQPRTRSARTPSAVTDDAADRRRPTLVVTEREYTNALDAVMQQCAVDEGGLLQLAPAISLEILSESSSLLLGSAPIILQIAHPFVSSAVRDHSYSFTPAAMKKRALNTLTHGHAMTFGSVQSIRRASRHVRDMHNRVRGRTRHRGEGARGSPFSLATSTGGGPNKEDRSDKEDDKKDAGRKEAHVADTKTTDVTNATLVGEHGEDSLVRGEVAAGRRSVVSSSLCTPSSAPSPSACAFARFGESPTQPRGAVVAHESALPPSTLVIASSASPVGEMNMCAKPGTSARVEVKERASTIKEDDAYAANDRRALLWVQATLIEYGVLAHEIFVRELSAAEKEEHYAFTRRIVGVWGLNPDDMPPTWPDFLDYYARVLHAEPPSTATQSSSSRTCHHHLQRTDAAVNILRLMHPDLGVAMDQAAPQQQTTAALSNSASSQKAKRRAPSFCQTLNLLCCTGNGEVKRTPWAAHDCMTLVPLTVADRFQLAQTPLQSSMRFALVYMVYRLIPRRMRQLTSFVEWKVRFQNARAASQSENGGVANTKFARLGYPERISAWVGRGLIWALLK